LKKLFVNTIGHCFLFLKENKIEGERKYFFNLRNQNIQVVVLPYRRVSSRSHVYSTPDKEKKNKYQRIIRGMSGVATTMP
jgi:hypothetical protein